MYIFLRECFFKFFVGGDGRRSLWEGDGSGVGNDRDRVFRYRCLDSVKIMRELGGWCIVMFSFGRGRLFFVLSYFYFFILLTRKWKFIEVK